MQVSQTSKTEKLYLLKDTIPTTVLPSIIPNLMWSQGLIFIYFQLPPYIQNLLMIRDHTDHLLIMICGVSYHINSVFSSKISWSWIIEYYLYEEA